MRGYEADMRTPVLALMIALAAPLLMGAGQPLPGRPVEFSDADKAELDRVSAYLNGVTTLKGDFVQLDPNGGLEQGSFSISKPGKMRFAYRLPAPTLIVSDGRTVAVANYQLNTVDRYTLSDTPLDLILGDKIDLSHNKSVIGISHDGGNLVVNARTSNNRSQANIAIVFAESELELREWTVIDNQGQKTTTALRDVVAGTPLDPALFVLPTRRKP
jgi:outer membrane lipoprotein-sorting protein